MQVLVGWDDPVEAETISLILNVDETDAVIAPEADEFREQLTSKPWDIVLLSTCFPSEDEALQLFLQVQEEQPNIPIVGAWKHHPNIPEPCFGGDIGPDAAQVLSRFGNRGEEPRRQAKPLQQSVGPAVLLGIKALGRRRVGPLIRTLPREQPVNQVWDHQEAIGCLK